MNQLKIDTLLKIQELFLTKGWEIHSRNAATLSLYDRFCERLKLFNEEQQELIIELTYNYTRVELTIYLEKFYESLFFLGDHTFHSFDNIFVYPLQSFSKTTHIKTKSAGFLHYMFETDDYTWLSPKFLPSSSLNFLIDKFNNQNSLLLLVDDFVGSGETAIDVCKEYLSVKTKNGLINKSNIKIVTIAAQKQGVDAVSKSLGIEVISAMIFERGISDRYTGTDRTHKSKLMAEIESIIRVAKNFQFGYNQTEALITMLNKTPNNTFPVYWVETKNKVAPFPRIKSFLDYGKQ